MKFPGKNSIFYVSLIAIGVVVIAFYWPKPPAQNQEVGSVEPGSDEHYRELIVGTWQDDYKGRRTLTVRVDRTATMVVEPEGLNALVASRLTFEEQWSIEGGQLMLKAVGGEPAARVSLILKTMGTESDQKILELTTDRLLLLDSDGETQYDWRRME